jgi:hypothetical protein
MMVFLQGASNLVKICVSMVGKTAITGAFTICYVWSVTLTLTLTLTLTICYVWSITLTLTLTLTICGR